VRTATRNLEGGVFMMRRGRELLYCEDWQTGSTMILRCLPSVLARPFSACGDTKRPDAIIKHLPSSIGVLLEIDENAHRSYDTSCEYA